MTEESRGFLFSDSEVFSFNEHTDKPTLLVALGGNALIRKGQEGTIDQQYENLKVPVQQIARLSRD